MKTKAAYFILGMELPYGIKLLSSIERSTLFDEARRKYHALLKAAHPDTNGERGGLSAAHNQTIELNRAFQLVKNSLVKQRLTFTEIIAMRAEKDREEAKECRARLGDKLGRSGGRTKAILQCSSEGELIKEWPSIKLAARMTNTSPTSISRSACRITRLAGGFLWRFKGVDYTKI